ncbi:transcriptional regulator [Bordetella pertussis]|nr:transcriptional regulator [Bordetella pertussis]
MNPLEKDIAESKPQLAPHEHARAPVTALAVDYRDGEHVLAACWRWGRCCAS